MKEIKNFKGKQMKIRDLAVSDLKRVPDFLDFINSLVDDQAKILINQKLTLKQEQQWLAGKLKEIKEKRVIFLVAECDNLIIGTVNITVQVGASDHVWNLGIAIRAGYRRLGLGKYLLKSILKIASVNPKKKPKIIKLSVFANNIPAITFYQKMKFKVVGKIPKQIRWGNRVFSEIIMIKELR